MKDLIRERMTSWKDNSKIIDGHWLYQGSVYGGGYGHVTIERKDYAIHRLIAHLFLGLDLDDLHQYALHKPTCQFKNCWNPEHLYVGCDSDNKYDRYRLSK